jgi:hypothetical protein
MTFSACIARVSANPSTTETFDVHCPSCRKTVFTPPVSVMKLVIPQFECEFCNHKQRLVANRPQVDEPVQQPTTLPPFTWISRLG